MIADTETNLRHRILREASRLFARYGADGISMREIAETVGISKAGIYYHFKDKEDLLLEILIDNVNRIEEVLQSAEVTAHNTRDCTRKIVAGIFALSPDQRAIIRIASRGYTTLGPERQEEFGRYYQDHFIGRIERVLANGIQSGEMQPADPALLTWILLGMMYPFFNPDPGETRDPRQEPVDLIVSVFFEGTAGNRNVER